MTDEIRYDHVGQERKRAAEYIRDETPDGDAPDSNTVNKVRANFQLGRAPDAEVLNVDQAYAKLQGREQERRADKAYEADSKRNDEEQAAKQEIRDNANWSPDDLQHLAGMQVREQQFHDSAARLNAAKQAFKTAQLGPFERQQAAAKIQEFEQQLLAEQQELQRLGNVVQTVAHHKQNAASLAELKAKDPRFGDPEYREKLVRFAVDELGITESRARAARDPNEISQVAKAMDRVEQQRREAHLNRPRAPLYQRGGFGANAMPAAMTIEEAAERMRRTGNMGDALNYMTLAREREQERS